MVHRFQSHFWVSFPNHGETVGPTCLEGRLTGAEASRRPRPPVDKGNDAVVFAIGSAPVEAGRIRAEHLQKTTLWPSAKC